MKSGVGSWRVTASVHRNLLLHNGRLVSHDGTVLFQATGEVWLNCLHDATTYFVSDVEELN